MAREDRTVGELEALIARLDQRRERIERTMGDLKAERQLVAEELNRTRQALEKRIKAGRRSGEPKVSTHALLRYVERILDIDLALLERHILSPANRAAIEAGATRITAGGVTLVVQNGVVVTVTEG